MSNIYNFMTQTSGGKEFIFKIQVECLTSKFKKNNQDANVPQHWYQHLVDFENMTEFSITIMELLADLLNNEITSALIDYRHF